MADQHTIYYSPSFSKASHKTTLTREQINAAIGHALTLLKEGKQVGEAKYPHAFKKHPIATNAQEPIFEFPILVAGIPYTGEKITGSDRVIFGSVATDYASADYVGVTGTPSTSDGSYKPHIFHDTSVNPGTHYHLHGPGHEDEHVHGNVHEDEHEHNKGHCHEHVHEHVHEHDHEHGHDGNTVTPPLTPPESRNLISESDVKVSFSD
ncbi:hypothetical protein SEPCBS57363_001074 [Sporothrix epigloea]|uniref:ribonuclease T1 n=1 Tax=Sporothrix epigloea TaxID=1892477 RepID=A0ABP0D8J4_9PEZI